MMTLVSGGKLGPGNFGGGNCSPASVTWKTDTVAELTQPDSYKLESGKET